MANPSPLLVIAWDSPKELFNQIYTLDDGLVFKWVGDYESLRLRIESDKPLNRTFAVKAVTPGTSLFTIYGNSIIVITNTDTECPIPVLALETGAVKWGITGSEQFTVQVADENTFSSPLVDETTTDNFYVYDLPAGTYYVRVKNIDTITTWSDITTLVVS